MKPLSVQEAFRGQELLVTGVTGFVGKVWVAFLLDVMPELGRLHLIVRPKANRNAFERMERLLERSPAFRPLRAKYGARLHEVLEERIQVHEGDCSKPNLGLKAPEQLIGRLDAVVHFAGLTDFQPDPAQGLPSNVRGAMYAADLAAQLKVPRLFHVSTAFVAGNQSGHICESISPGVAPNQTIFDPEVELEAAEALSDGQPDKAARIDRVTERAQALGYPNCYTYTKGLAEHLLSSRNDIQLTLLRPSIIESSLSFPFRGWNEGVNTSGPIVWLMSSWLRRLPAKANNHFDVIPVDETVKGLTLAIAAGLSGDPTQVYQFASSATNPLTFERAVDLNALAYRRINKDSPSRRERWLKSQLGGALVDPDSPPFPSVNTLRGAARELLTTLRKVDPAQFVTAAYERSNPGEAERRKKQFSQLLRNIDRTLKRTDEMLELYRPFIYDNDYIFDTDHIHKLNQRLDARERELFGFDINSLCWRDYWINVHVPGLETWSIPLLKGERALEDPPFAAAKRGTTRYRVAEGA